MGKNILSVRDIGYSGLPAVLGSMKNETKLKAEKFSEGFAALLFARESVFERLSISRTLKTLGLEYEYFAPGAWKRDSLSLSTQAPMYDLFADARLCYGLKQESLQVMAASGEKPTINLGNEAASPCRLLADLDILSRKADFSNLRIAWIGGSAGLANSLIEAAMFLPFELFMALPEWGEPNRETLGLALQSGAKIFLTREPRLALQGARFVYAGQEKSPDFSGNGRNDESMLVNEETLALAEPGAGLLLGRDFDDPARDSSDIWRHENSLLMAQMGNVCKAQAALLRMALTA